MKQHIKYLLFSLLIVAIFIPLFSLAVTAVGWSTPTPTTGYISPNAVNGTNQSIFANAGLFSTASSTFSSSLYLSSLSQGFAGVGTNGLVYTFATSSIKTSQLTNDVPFVTSLTVASANGFAGSSSGGATPALTLTTTINSAVLKGNGTAISGAVNGTDFTLITAKDCTGTGHVLSVTATGTFTCSADSGSGTSAFEIATTSTIAVPQLAYFTNTSGRTTLGGVATSTVSFSSPLSGTSVSVVGTGGGAITCPTCALTGTTITVNGTTNQITSSAGAQDLSANRTWTLSIPDPFKIGQASTTVLSANSAYFGGTATTSFSQTGVVTLGTTTAGCLQNNASGVVWSATCAGGGSVTSITAGDGLMGVPPVITTSGTIYGQVSTATLPVLGQVPYWATLGTVNSPAKLSSVATSSIASGVGITVTNGSTAYVLGAQPSVACNTASASVFGCISAASFSKHDSATTTFSSPLVYTGGTNAVTCPTCMTGYDAFTHSSIFLPTSATTSKIAIGTTTPYYSLTVASTTGAQLALSDGISGDTSWAFRALPQGLLSIVPTDTAGTATTTATGFNINSTGQILQNYLGTQSLPAYTFNGDPDTGIYRSGTNSITLTTGGIDSGIFTGGGGRGGFWQIDTIGTISTASFRCVIVCGTQVPGIWFDTNVIGFGFSVGSNSENARFTKSGFGVGTTTPNWPLQIATTTLPQLALTGNPTDNHWTLRSIGSNFYLATASPTTYATTTKAAFSITNGGEYSISTSTVGCVNTNSVGLLYSATCTSFSNTIAGGGTGSTQFAGNSIITSNPAGTALIATGTQLTVGNILATTTAVNQFNGVVVVPDGSLGNPAFSFADDQNNGIYSPANDIFAISTNGIERMRIDDGSGKSMFGTTTAQLSSIMTLGSSTAPQLTLSSNTGGIAQWAFRTAGGDLFISTTTTAGSATTSTAALTLSGNGKPGIFIGATTTASLATLDVLSSGSDFANMFIVATSGRTSLKLDNNGQVFLNNYPNCSTTNALQISSGQLICGSTVSDIRLKKDIEPITNGLSTVLALFPVSYYWNDLKYHNTTDPREQIGFIAQEVEKVIPSAVGLAGDGSGYKTVDKTAIIPYLVEAIQTLSQAKGFVPIKRSMEENWQWIVIGLLVVWNIGLTIRKRK